MYCKYIKLTNGEDIITLTEEDCDNLNGKEYLSIVEPVLISSVRFPRGGVVVESYVMQTWIKMAKTTSVHLPIRNIIAIVDVEQKAIDQYMKYVDETRELEKKFIESDFDDSDEDILEEFVNAMSADVEEDEDDEYARNDNERIIH